MDNSEILNADTPENAPLRPREIRFHQVDFDKVQTVNDIKRILSLLDIGFIEGSTGAIMLCDLLLPAITR